LIANELAPKIISEMEYYSNIEYPTDTGMKVDQIAIPDMNFQAMENWGLITYRYFILFIH
jgi:aminopeptidase N